jgi:hypothetical protein
MEQAKNKEDTESSKMKSPLRIIYLDYSTKDRGLRRKLFYLLIHADKTKITIILIHFYI